MNIELPTIEDAVSVETLELLRRAECGDPSVAPDLQALLDARPDLWRRLSDVASRSEQALLGTAAGEDLLMHEALLRRLCIVRDELAGPSPSPQVRLLAAWVAQCWLYVHIAQMEVASCEEDGDLDRPRMRLALDRLDRAHFRYLRATKLLAKVRRSERAAGMGALTDE